MLSYSTTTNHPVEQVISTSINYASPFIDQPKLITDVRVINDFMWQEIKKNPSVLFKLHPRKFEEIVADMFDKMGYEVTLTQATRDGGKDMYLLQHTDIGKTLYLVECKRNSPEYPVGVGVINQIYGRINHEKATAGIVVTTSTFTKPAKEFQSKVPYQISLVNYARLCKIIESLI